MQCNNHFSYLKNEKSLKSVDISEIARKKKNIEMDYFELYKFLLFFFKKIYIYIYIYIFFFFYKEPLRG